MTRDEINSEIDRLAKKRDLCCDVLKKPALGLSYQQEIDRLAAILDNLPQQLVAECPACGVSLNIQPPPSGGEKPSA